MFIYIFSIVTCIRKSILMNVLQCLVICMKKNIWIWIIIISILNKSSHLLSHYTINYFYVHLVNAYGKESIFIKQISYTVVIKSALHKRKWNGHSTNKSTVIKTIIIIIIIITNNKNKEFNFTPLLTLTIINQTKRTQMSYFQLINQQTCLSLPPHYLYHHITYFNLLFKIKNEFKTVNRKWLHIKYSAISWDVAQRSFNKCTAKQMSFESGFNVLAHLITYAVL